MYYIFWTAISVYKEDTKTKDDIQQFYDN